MRKTLLRNLASLLLPFAAYGAQASYGAYQRRSLSKTSGLSLPLTNPPSPTPVRRSASVKAGRLAIVPGTVTRELIIVDASVQDRHIILKQARPGIDVVEIKAGDDGVAALMRALEGYKGLHAVHVVAHAEAGAMFLAGHKVDEQTLLDRVGAFAALNHAIREGGDLLLYGCDLAQGKAGDVFLEILRQNTHVDIAASLDKTGNEAQGGNWELEIRKGDIAAQPLPESIALRDFSSLLAVANGTITFSAGWTDGGATLTSDHFIVSAHDGGDSSSLNVDIYEDSKAFITNTPTTATNYFYVKANGTGTATFELTGLSASEYYDGQINFTNVRIVGVRPDNTTITSTDLDGTLVNGAEDFNFGPTQLANFSGQQIKGFKLYFEVTTRTAAGGGGGPHPSDAGLFDFNNFTVANAQNPANNDGTVTAGTGVNEPVGLSTTSDTTGEAVDVFDFKISDGGTGDSLPLIVSQIVVNVSGTSTDVDRGKITWRLNGPDASNAPGNYSAATDKITFSGLSISVASGGNETYTVNAYYNDNTSVTDGRTIVLSVDGDTDLTLGTPGATTTMGSTTAVNNSSGTTLDVVATQLVFTTQPGGSVSGAALTTQPAVTARDAFGNTDTGFTETITVTEASVGSLTNNTKAAVAGVATFTGLTYTATADQEPFTLTANDQDGVGSDLSTADSNSVTSDVVATKLRFATEPAPTGILSATPVAFSTVPIVQATNAADIVDTGYSTGIALAVTDPNDGNVDGTVNSLTGTGDTDGSGTTVTLTPSSGAATFTGLSLTYTNGGATDSIALRATSGGLTGINSSAITSTSNISPSFNDGAAQMLTVDEDDTATSINGLLDVVDPDSGQTLTWSVTSSPTKGTLGGFNTTEATVGNATPITPGALTYTPALNRTGSDSFVIQVSDGTTTDSITVNVTINALDDVPVAGLGGALNFEFLRSEGVQVADNPAFDWGTSSFTVEAWVKRTGSGSGHFTIAAKEAGSGNGWFFRFNDNLLSFSAGANGINTTATITDTDWHHVAAVLDATGKTAAIYIDGGLSAQSGVFGAASNIDNAQHLGIGFKPGWGEYFDGSIDDVRIWTTARTVAEIREYMRTPIAGDETGLVGYWNFEEGSGTSTANRTATSDLEGTLVNPDGDEWITGGIPSRVTTPEDTAALLRLGGSDFDSQSSATAVITVLPEHGDLFQTDDGATPDSQIIAIDTALTDISGNPRRVIYVPDLNYSGPDTFTYKVNDGSVDSGNTVTVDFTVSTANDAPIATNLTQSKSAIEGGSAVALDAIVVTDIDDGDTIAATLTLSDPGAGTLSAGTYGSATSTYDAGTGVWTVTGSVADVNAALAAVAFTPSANNDQNFTIATLVRDLTNTGPVAGTISFTVTAVNDNPGVFGLPASLTFTEDAIDAPFQLGLDTNDFTDPDSANLTVTLTVSSGKFTLANHGGTLTQANGNGTGEVILGGTLANVNVYFDQPTNISWTPPADLAGNDAATLSLTANDGDGSGEVSLGSVALNITAVNDAPVLAAGGTLPAVDEDTETPAGAALNTLGITANDTADGGTISGYAITANTANSSTQGAWQYSTNAGANWHAIGSVNASAALALSADTLVRFVPVANFNGAPAVLTIRALDANVSSFSVGAGTQTRATLDTTTNGGSTSISSATASISTTITSINDTPTVATNTGLTQAEGALGMMTSAHLNTTDLESAAGAITYTVTTLPTHGTLIRNGSNLGLNSTFTQLDINTPLVGYQHDGGETTSDSFGFSVSDGTDSVTAQTFALTVTPVNDAPAGADNTVTTNEDSAYIFAAADFGFTDPSDATANALADVKVTTLPGTGTLTNNGLAVNAGDFVPVADISGNQLMFTPADDANGAAYASFTFQVRDDGGTANGGIDLDASANTMTIDVTAVNDAPAGANKTIALTEDGSHVFATSDFGFTDPNDSPANTLAAVKIATLPGAGSLENDQVAVSADDLIAAADIVSGKLVFKPSANGSGDGYASFTFQVQDDGGVANGGVDLDLSANTITLDVIPVAETPDITTATTEQNTQTTSGLVISRGSGDGAEVTHFKITAIIGGTLFHNDGTTQITEGAFITFAEGNAGLKFTPDTDASTMGGDTFSFDVQAATDNAGAGLSSAATASITVDDVIAPELSSIIRQSPVTVNTNVASVTWRVAFDEDVTNVDAGDFALTVVSGSASGTIAAAAFEAVDAKTYDVTVDTLAGQGQLRLDLKSTGTGIADIAGNALPDGGFIAGDFYLVGVENVLDTTMLLGDAGQTRTVSSASAVAQRFTTATDAPLTLTTVTASLGAVTGSELEVRVFTDDGGEVGDPISTLTLNGSLEGGALNVWRSAQLLEESTTYWIVFTASSGTYEIEATADTTVTGGEGDWLTGNYAYRHGATGENSETGALLMAIGATSVPSITNSPLTASGTYGAAFTYQITATNTPTSYAATNLPNGLTLNTTTGLISGSPTQTGTFNAISLTATNGSGTSAPATLVLTIDQAGASVSLSTLTRTYTGQPRSPTITTSPGGLPVTVTYNGSTTVPTEAGSYNVVATVSDPDYSGSGSATFTITKANATISLGSLSHTYDGTVKSATATTVPAGLNVTLSYDPANPTQPGSYTVTATLNAPNHTGTATGTLTIVPAVTAPPVVPSVGSSVQLSATDGLGGTGQWQRNGSNLLGATGPSLTLDDMQPPTAGLYTYTATLPGGGSGSSEPLIVGLTTDEKVIGEGEQVLADVQHPNGNVYDQVLLEGNGASITADTGKITRVSFVDLTNDIVQVEFSGAGTLSVVMDDASMPAPAINYNQAEVDYVRGHVGLVITGANETSNLSIISVGPITAVNQTLFKEDVVYDGVADIAFVAIQSANGKFGGIRTGNVSYYASQGFTGVYAPGVEFAGPVNIGEVTAFDSATPVLVFGAAGTVNITGGNLEQDNGSPVTVSGITKVQFVTGQTSQGVTLPAQANAGVLVEDGVDVTRQIVVNP